MIDRVNSPRYLDQEYYEAINLATSMIFEDRVNNIKIKKGYSFESEQRLRDEMYTLIKNVTGAPSGNLIPLPSDYNTAILVEPTIAGTLQAARPLSYNELSFIERNPFKQFSEETVFYIEQSTGLDIKYAGGSFSAYSLWYLKNPATVTIGVESDKLTTGATLTSNVLYIVYNQSVYNGVTYYPGDIITGTGIALTSGIVIPRSVTVDSDMPDKILPEICRLAGAILSGTVADYNKKQDLIRDNNSQ